MLELITAVAVIVGVAAWMVALEIRNCANLIKAELVQSRTEQSRQLKLMQQLIDSHPNSQPDATESLETHDTDFDDMVASELLSASSGKPRRAQPSPPP